MMLRQGVKVRPTHDRIICSQRVLLTFELTYSMFSGIREELSFLSSTLSIIPKTSTSFYPVTSKEQVIVSDLRSRLI